MVVERWWRRMAKGATGRTGVGAWHAILSSLAAAACLAILALPSAAPAQNQSELDAVFVVRAVPVDVTAGSAAEARTKAVAAGRRAAWQRLMRRLVLDADLPRVNQISEDQLLDLVVGFEVERERTSAVRYLGDITYRFNRMAVRRHLGQTGVGFAETRSRPVLIVPLYMPGSVPVLWEETNQWLAAWAGLPPADGLLPLAVPYGDLADIRDLSPVQALLGEADALQAIGKRYGAERAVVVHARPLGSDPATATGVELTVSRFGGANDGGSTVETVMADGPADSIRPLLDKAARWVAHGLEETWKRDNLIRPGLETRVTVVVPVDGFESWMAIRRRLDGISTIVRRDLLRLTRREAMLDLWVNGGVDQFAVALKQSGLVLTEWNGDWVLSDAREELPERYRTPVEPTPAPLAPAAPAPAGPLVLPALKP